MAVTTQHGDGVMQKNALHLSQHFLCWPATLVFLTDKRGYLRDEGLAIAFTDGDYAVHDSAESTTGYRVILKRGIEFDARHRFAFTTRNYFVEHYARQLPPAILNPPTDFPARRFSRLWHSRTQ